MKKEYLADVYLRRYAIDEKWELIHNGAGYMNQIVVIPAYAEKDMLFTTLASLARNHPSALEHSLVLCVVNNKEGAPRDVKENNTKTLDYLSALVKRASVRRFQDDAQRYRLLTEISDTGMQLGFVDASGKDREIPRDSGGVGTARKIGMDKALRLLKEQSVADGVIISLDADTLVQQNYLSVIRERFRPGIKTAVVAYEHQMPEDAIHQAAICSYEIFLRYWVLALQYAGSPWAFHSIGSAMCVSAQAYLEVRGMNRKEAGEDFYFLNKLAKIGKINYIKETCVFPSARSSLRVPFGTGRKIHECLSGESQKQYDLYDPRIFTILRQWLELMRHSYGRETDIILIQAEKIHPALKDFLQRSRFGEIWPRISRVTKDAGSMDNQLKSWFDAFRTMKLVNYFTRNVYRPVNMFEAIGALLSLSGVGGCEPTINDKTDSLERQQEILRRLRTLT